MNKKTLILIIILFIVTGGLLYIAMSPKTKNVSVETQPTTKPSPIPFAQTVLSFSPSQLIIASQSASIDITINTGTNKATATQLDIMYDSKVVTIKDISAGSFFENPIILRKTIDPKLGKINYIIATPPTGIAKSGAGTVAKISFTTTIPSGGKTDFTFGKDTLVTADGQQSSVIKSTTNASVFYLIQKETNTSTSSGSTIMGPVKPSVTSGTN